MMNGHGEQQLIIIIKNGDVAEILVSKDVYRDIIVAVVDIDLKTIISQPKMYIPKRRLINSSYIVKLFGEFAFFKNILNELIINFSVRPKRTNDKKVIAFRNGLMYKMYSSVVEAAEDNGIYEGSIRQSSRSGLPYKGTQYYTIERTQNG